MNVLAAELLYPIADTVKSFTQGGESEVREFKLIQIKHINRMIKCSKSTVEPSSVISVLPTGYWELR